MALNRGLALIAALAMLGANPSWAQEPEFVLRDTCPPSFETTANGVCQLHSLYDFYDSVQGAGLGGTQTELPAHRDGFTAQQIDLGRYLFFDPVLSGDGSVSCATCHDPEQGFADGLPRSVGIRGQQVPRAAPTLWNAAYLNSFFWDARAHTLEEQVVGPLFASNEMDTTPAQLLAALNAIPAYQTLFQQAFPQRQGEDISLDEVYVSLAAFQTSLISLNSRYDRYAHGYHAALSDQEVEGLNIFRSFVARCAECHTPPLFTNQQVAVIGAPEPAGLPLDIGAQKTYDAPQLKAGFKVPTLRNIAKTAPYMHSGAFATLHDVTVFYNGGRGHAVPEGVDLQLHWHMTSPNLTDYELDRLVDFLGTLTDESLTPEVPEHVPSGLAPAHGGSPSDIATTNNTSGDAS